MMDRDRTDGKLLFQELTKGIIRSGGFDLNGMWSPWYVQHKIFAGLRDAYRRSAGPLVRSDDSILLARGNHARLRLRVGRLDANAAEEGLDWLGRVVASFWQGGKLRRNRGGVFVLGLRQRIHAREVE